MTTTTPELRGRIDDAFDEAYDWALEQHMNPLNAESFALWCAGQVVDYGRLEGTFAGLVMQWHLETF